MSEPVIIPKGALLTISTGVYSDYTVWGVFRALVDIDVGAEREAWLVAYPKQREEYHFDDDAFMADVAKRGLVEAIPSYEWHLGEYSNGDFSVRQPDDQ